jgi:hypothetical protein
VEDQVEDKEEEDTVLAKIESVSAIGTALVKFSKEMETDVPLEYFNETSINITV